MKSQLSPQVYIICVVLLLMGVYLFAIRIKRSWPRASVFGRIMLSTFFAFVLFAFISTVSLMSRVL